MKIEKSFAIDHPRDVVWKNMGDVHLVAQCLPGAAIVEDLGDDRHKGRLSVKVGPLAASFDGELSIERRAEEFKAIVSGKGADVRSSSRASGSMTYWLTSDGESEPTQVHVVSEVNLAGALAQFSKGAVMQEVANRITAEFARNFEQRLSARADDEGAPKQESAAIAAPTQADSDTHGNRPAPRPLNAGGLVWSILKDRIVSAFRRVFGRRPG